jgi:hypothetical protein
MSAPGQYRSSTYVGPRSVYLPTTDPQQTSCDFRSVPEAEVSALATQYHSSPE